MYRENTKFGQTYEREFRVFAADDSEKRLRFKPMQANQRAFLHSLAEDFGLDSMSQDPEPHRHVYVFKTPRFVSAPMKTLAQCVKITSSSTPQPAEPAKSLMAPLKPYNAFIISSPRFGLTIDELHTALLPEMDFDISFMPNGEIILLARGQDQKKAEVEGKLVALKSAVKRRVTREGLAATVVLGVVGPLLNIVRRDDNSEGSGGWSQVAKGGSGLKVPGPSQVETKTPFAVLGKASREKGAKKKLVEQDAVDDWEREVDGWEQS